MFDIRLYNRHQTIKANGGVGVSLARIFLKKPKLCILDEPTAALDSNTETLIYKNIETFLSDATKVIVIHNYQNILPIHKTIEL